MTSEASIDGKESGRIVNAMNVWRAFYTQKKTRERGKNTPLRSRLAFVASATNLGLGSCKLPNAPASEFTSTTTATLTRTRATMWQHTCFVCNTSARLSRGRAPCEMRAGYRVRTHSIRTYEDADTFFTKRFSFRGALPEKRERDDAPR